MPKLTPKSLRSQLTQTVGLLAALMWAVLCLPAAAFADSAFDKEVGAAIEELNDDQTAPVTEARAALALAQADLEHAKSQLILAKARDAAMRHRLAADNSTLRADQAVLRAAEEGGDPAEIAAARAAEELSTKRLAWRKLSAKAATAGVRSGQARVAQAKSNFAYAQDSLEVAKIEAYRDHVRDDTDVRVEHAKAKKQESSGGASEARAAKKAEKALTAWNLAVEKARSRRPTGDADVAAANEARLEDLVSRTAQAEKDRDRARSETEVLRAEMRAAEELRAQRFVELEASMQKEQAVKDGRIAELEQRLDEQQAQLSIAQRAAAEAKDAREGADSNRVELDAELARLNLERETEQKQAERDRKLLEQRVADLSGQLEKSGGESGAQISRLNAELEAARLENQRLNERINSAETARAAVDTLAVQRLAELEAERAARAVESAAAADAAADLERSLTSKVGEAEIKAAKSVAAADQAAARAQALTEERDTLAAARKADAQRIEVADRKLAELTGKLDAAKAERARVQSDLDASRAGLMAEDEERAAMEKRLTDAAAERDALNARLEQLGRERTELTAQVTAVREGSAEASRRHVAEITALEQRLRAEVETGARRAGELDQQVAELRGERDAITERLNVLKTERDALTAEAARLRSSEAQGQERVKELQASLAAAKTDFEAKLDELRNKNADEQSETGRTIASLQTEMQTLRADNQAKAAESDKLRASEAGLKKDVAGLMAERDTAKAETAEVKSRMDSELRVAKDAKNKAEADVAAAKRRGEELTAAHKLRVDQLEAARATAMAEQSAAWTKLDAAETRIAGLEIEADGLRDELAQVTERHDSVLADMRARTETLTEELKAAQSAGLKDARARDDAAAKQLADLNGRIDVVSRERDGLIKASRELSSQVETLTAELNAANEHLVISETSINALQQEMSAMLEESRAENGLLSAEVRSLNRRVEETEKALQAARARNDEMRVVSEARAVELARLESERLQQHRDMVELMESSRRARAELEEQLRTVEEMYRQSVRK